MQESEDRDTGYRPPPLESYEGEGEIVVYDPQNPLGWISFEPDSIPRYSLDQGD